MSVVKKSTLLASALVSAALLTGCQSGGTEDSTVAVDADATPSTAAPAEDAPAEAAPARELDEEAGPITAEPASDHTPEVSQTPSGNPEEDIIAAIEEVLGEGGCYKKDEHTPGTPLEEWTLDPAYIEDYGPEHGPLHGTLTRYWCAQPPDSAPHPATPDHISFGFFTDETDFESDKQQLLAATRLLEDAHYYANDGGLWTADSWSATPETWSLMEDLGAPVLSFDGH